jgi:hypothetical protein
MWVINQLRLGQAPTGDLQKQCCTTHTGDLQRQCCTN